MIRLFLNVCKLFHKIKHLDDYTIYSSFLDLSPSMAPSCPSCHAPSSSYSRNGSYQRYLICYTCGTVQNHRISVPSVSCTSCGRSHALLLSLIIPYSSFSLGFLVSLLYARLTRRFPNVPSLCAHFGISESTFYRIRKRFLLDSRLLFDAIRSFLDITGLLDALPSLDPCSFHHALDLFFQSAGYSFLQPCVRLRPKVPIHSIPP